MFAFICFRYVISLHVRRADHILLDLYSYEELCHNIYSLLCYNYISTLVTANTFTLLLFDLFSYVVRMVSKKHGIRPRHMSSMDTGEHKLNTSGKCPNFILFYIF